MATKHCFAFMFLISVACSVTSAQSMTEKYPELMKPVVVAEGDKNPDNQVIIVTGCSPTKPRTGEVFLEWPGGLASFSDHRVDVTFYLRGFETNQFTTLYPIDNDKRMQVIDRKMLVRAEVENSLELRVLSVDTGDKNRPAVIQLEGLGSGLSYTWRILQKRKDDWLSSEPVQVYGPTCPSDEVDRN